ncbi:MAG: efflux RND transporter periplasmic adaptor subunit, partial [Novipirellula sp. JB048]
DLVYEHGTRAIANSMSHSNLFLMPVWRALGRASWVLRARTLPKTLGVVGLVLAGILALIFIPKDFTLEAEGTLTPERRREIFAPIDGEVIEVLVDHNAPVTEGQALVRLRNRDLEIQLTDIEGQIQTALAEKARNQGQLTQRKSLEPAERRALEGEVTELDTKRRVLIEKKQMLIDRAEQLTIRSPIDGIVTTWDVEKMLRSRPISTGQVLLEVADLRQPLFLKLELPEKREGHLDEYIEQNHSEELDVTYILATNPDVKLDATLQVAQISARAEPNEEHGAVIKMSAYPEQSALQALRPRPGAKVIAKIYCGRRASGFVFFHEIYEWCCKFFF